MKKYYFPLNYDESNKILGFFDYKLILPISIYGLLIAIIISFFSISFLYKIGFFLTLFLPAVFLINTSINKEPFYIFIFFVIKHHFSSHKYLLSEEIIRTFHNWKYGVSLGANNRHSLF